MTSHSDFMRMALEEAAAARDEGEVPVGALLVKEGAVLASDHNGCDATGDPSAHAEILVLREASGIIGDWRLLETILYVTLEPCPMCAGAIVLARVGTVVYGASDPRAGAVGSAYNVLEDGRLGHRVEVIAGVLEDECLALMQGFFDGLR